MNIATQFLRAAAVAAFAMQISDADAAKLSGAYSYSSSVTCQSRLNWTSANAVRSVTSGPVLTSSTLGSVVGSLVNGTAITGTSTSQAVTSVDFGGSSTQTAAFVDNATIGSVVTDGISQAVVTSTTPGTGLLSASSGPVLLNFTIIGSGAVISESVGTATFNSTTKKMTAHYVTMGGPAIRQGNGTPGDALSVKRAVHTQSNTPYTTGVAAAIINGENYDATFGNVVSGTAGHASLINLKSNGCVTRITLTR